MAEFTTSVQIVSGGANTEKVVCGEALENGRLVYKDGADNNEAKEGVANDAAKDAIVGVVLIDGDNAEETLIATDGCKLRTSATLTVGTSYILGGVSTHGPGCWESIDNRASGDYVTVIGTADTANTLVVDIDVTGVAVP